jgi:cold shock CspA family protein
MQVAPEIDIKNVANTGEIGKLLEQQLVRLEKVCDYIVSIRVAVQKEQFRHQEGNPYRVRIDVRVPPNHEIVVKRNSAQHPDVRQPPDAEEEAADRAKRTTIEEQRKDEPLPALIRRAFDIARRQLQELVERQRGEMKTHPQNQVMAFVEKLLRDEGYGFLRTIEGEQVYFNKNSTLHDEWDRLVAGTGVRFTAEQGEKGKQATSLEIVDKPGAFEVHDELHDLPVVTHLKKKTQ